MKRTGIHCKDLKPYTDIQDAKKHCTIPIVENVKETSGDPSIIGHNIGSSVNNDETGKMSDDESMEQDCDDHERLALIERTISSMDSGHLLSRDENSIVRPFYEFAYSDKTFIAKNGIISICDEHVKFLRLLMSDRNKLLLLCGDPGTGKSMIVNLAVSYLRSITFALLKQKKDKQLEEKEKQSEITDKTLKTIKTMPSSTDSCSTTIGNSCEEKSYGKKKSIVKPAVIDNDDDVWDETCSKIALTAMTSAAAERLDGAVTIHSFSGVRDSDGNNNSSKRGKSFIRKDVLTRLSSSKFLFIDEVSMMSPSFFDALARQFNIAYGVDENCTDYFSNLRKIVLIGDFYQLKPVNTENTVYSRLTNDAMLFDSLVFKHFSNIHVDDEDNSDYEPDDAEDGFNHSSSGRYNSDVQIDFVNLQKLFRTDKNDLVFSKLLKAVKTNRLDPSDIATMDSRIKSFKQFCIEVFQRRQSTNDSSDQLQSGIGTVMPSDRDIQNTALHVNALFFEKVKAYKHNEMIMERMEGDYFVYVGSFITSPKTEEELTTLICSPTRHMPLDTIDHAGRHAGNDAWHLNMGSNLNMLQKNGFIFTTYPISNIDNPNAGIYHSSSGNNHSSNNSNNNTQSNHHNRVSRNNANNNNTYNKSISSSASYAASSSHSSQLKHVLQKDDCNVAMYSDTTSLGREIIPEMIKSSPFGRSSLVTKLKIGVKVSFTKNINKDISNGREGTVIAFMSVIEFMSFSGTKRLKSGVYVNYKTEDLRKQKYVPSKPWTNMPTETVLGPFTSLKHQTSSNNNSRMFVPGGLSKQSKKYVIGYCDKSNSQISHQSVELYPVVRVMIKSARIKNVPSEATTYDTANQNDQSLYIDVLATPVMKKFDFITSEMRAYVKSTADEITRVHSNSSNRNNNASARSLYFKKSNHGISTAERMKLAVQYSNENDIYFGGKSSLNFYSLGLPITVCHGKTLHSVQGLTLSDVWLEVPEKTMQSGMLFVFMSRVKNLFNLAFSSGVLRHVVTNNRCKKFLEILSLRHEEG